MDTEQQHEPRDHPPPRKRRRPALSCVQCRRRKVRCDRTQPCRNCVTGLCECIYQAFVSEPILRAPPVTALTPTMGRGSYTVAPVQYSHGEHDAQNEAPHQRSYPIVPQLQADAREENGRGTSLNHQTATSLQDATGNHGNLEHQLLKDRPADYALQPGMEESGWHILKQQVGLKDSDVPLNKHRPPRWSEWLGTAPEKLTSLSFSIIYACYSAAGGASTANWFLDAETASLIPKISELLQQAKTLAVKIKASRPSRSTLQTATCDLSPPSRELADAMIDLYFQFFESTYRILHRPTFREEYEKFWTSPNAAPVSLRLKVLLAVAIGGSLHEAVDKDRAFHNTAHQWICAAQDWLLAPSEKARLDLSGIQVHCLAFFARQVYSTSADLVWISAGNMLNAAIQLNLHRDPKHITGTSLLDAEIRRRLWATIVEMEMQTSMDTAMAVRIRMDDFDTEPPAHINDDEVSDKIRELRPHPRSQYTDTSLQLLLVDTRPIRLQILQLLNGLHSKFLYADALSLSNELTNAHRTFTKFIQDNSKSGLTAFHRNLVDFFVCRFLVPLHGPFASKARTNPLFHYSRRVGVDASMAIVSPEPSEPYTRLMTVGGNLLREGLRCAITSINLELVVQADSDRQDGTLHRPSPFTEVLKKAVKDTMWLSEEQIKRHETNIRLHNLLASILAIVDRGGSDVSMKKVVSQAAIDSFEHCLGLLQTVVDSLPTSTSTEMDSVSGLDFGLEDWELDWNMEILMPGMSGVWGSKNGTQTN